MKTLVVLLNRTGDIVQSSPLFELLHIKGVEVDVVVLEHFAEVCKCIPSLSNVHMLSKGFNLNDFVTKLTRNKYDLVINFTPTRQAATLASMVQARQRRGLGMSFDGAGAIAWGRWASYYMMVARNKAMNLFNIVDMFKSMAECHGKVGSRTLAPDPSVNVDELLPHEELFVVAPGASTPDRCWHVVNYAKICRMVMEKYGLRPVLVGTEKEGMLSKVVKEYMKDEVVDLTGKTSIIELVSVLDQATFVVGNDSAPVHIAARLNRPTLCLSLSHARYWSTGPYGDDTYVLQHNDPSLVSVGQVMDMVKRVMGDKNNTIRDGAEAVKSDFTKDGFLTYRLLVRKPLDVIHFVSYVMRHTSPLYFMMEQTEKIDDLVKVLQEDYIVSNDFEFDLKESMVGFGLLSDLFLEAESICHEMGEKSDNKINIPRLRELKGKLDSIDEAMQVVGKQFPHTYMILGIFFTTRSSVESHDVGFLSMQYGYWSSLFAKWCQLIIDVSLKAGEMMTKG